MHLVLDGINIQHPISRLIVEGKKTIETRTYPLPLSYVEKDVFLIETPGKAGGFKAQIVAVVRFSKSFQYKSERAFYADTRYHFVTKDSPWAWKSTKSKW